MALGTDGRVGDHPHRLCGGTGRRRCGRFGWLCCRNHSARGGFYPDPDHAAGTGGFLCRRQSCGGPAGRKNLAGAFYQPKLVVIDPDVLTTLSDRAFSDGMAEVIKYGCIRNGRFFALLEELGSRRPLWDT